MRYARTVRGSTHATTTEDQPWTLHAACGIPADPEHDPFYDPPRIGRSRGYPSGSYDWAEAQAICATCPVTTICRDQARARGERHGYFGGESPDQRIAWLTAHHRPVMGHGSYRVRGPGPREVGA